MAKLSKLHLENFGCHKTLDIEFCGQDGKIIGANRVGKTTIINAICYLLSDCLLGANANVPSIKNHDDTRAKVVVEGVFYTEEGDVVLRKEFYEKWVRPRGSATDELQGHSTDYFINGAKQARARDFSDAIVKKFGIPPEFSGMDAYQLAIDPFYLGAVICGSDDWKLARKAIIEIVGDVTPEEIYAANADAAIAKVDLESHQFDDGEAKKAIGGEIKGYKDKITANETLLADYGRALESDVGDEEYAKASKEVEEIDQQIAKIRLGDSNPYAEEVAGIQQELYRLQSEYSASLSSSVDHTKSDAIRQRLSKLRDDLAHLNYEESLNNSRIQSLEATLAIRKRDMGDAAKRMESLKQEYNSIVVDDCCPTCGQKLPQEQVEEAINKKKAGIIEEANHIKERYASLKSEVERLQAEMASLLDGSVSQEIAKVMDEIAKDEQELYKAETEEKANPIGPDPAIKSRIDELQARLENINKLKLAGSQSKAAEIQQLQERKASYQAIFSRRIAADNARKRIAELKAENIALGKRLSDAEQRLWAVGEFVKTKLSLLNEHMAMKLGEVRFQLIKENIKKGSYDEVCKPYIISPLTGKHTETLFSEGSRSEQIFTGVQIIKSIRDALGWQPLPIVFDQGGELDDESTRKVAYNAEAQVIEVKVEGNGTKPTFVPFVN